MGTLLIYLTSFAMGFIRTVWALVLMKPQDEHLSMFTIQTHLLNMLLSSFDFDRQITMLSP
jgi:hypothetical protein